MTEKTEEVKDLMNYDEIIAKAMRNALYTVFKKVEKNGLLSNHYFVISFSTMHKDIVLSDRVKQIYPETITIILQNQFRNLKADAKHFEVELSFNKIPEIISVPYDAIINFADPSVNFELGFDEFQISEDEEFLVDNQEKNPDDLDIKNNLIDFDLLLKNKK